MRKVTTRICIHGATKLRLHQRQSLSYKRNRTTGDMSQEELARFRKALAIDFNGSIRRKIGDINDGEEVAKKANELGYHFTHEEWKAAPKLDPKYIWVFIAVVVVFTNWSLIESQFSRMNERFQGGSIEEPKRP